MVTLFLRPPTDDLLERFIGKKVKVYLHSGFELEGCMNYNSNSLFYDDCKYKIENDENKYTYYINAEDMKGIEEE